MSIETKRYAMNLIDMAGKENKLDAFFNQYKKINDLLNSDSELHAYIDDSNISIDEKRSKLLEMVSVKNSEAVEAFILAVKTIASDHCETSLLHDFLAQYYLSKGSVFGVVYSIRTLTEKELADLEKAMSKQVEKDVKLENKIDLTLLGGLKVVVGDNIWDNSYKNRLNAMRASLMADDEKLAEKASQITVSLNEKIDEVGTRKKVEVQTSDKVGYVKTVADGIVNIGGMYKCMAGELIKIGEANAMVMNLEADNIGAILLGESEDVVEGSQAIATGRIVEVPVGDQMLGRVVNALGQPIDGLGPIVSTKYYPIERPAPGVIDRQSVNQPLETGIKIIDSMIPIGKGQRELIIGDRQTGKTAIAIDAILNQAGKNVYCIYVAIGQKNSTVAQTVEKLRQTGAMNYTTVVCAGASESAALQYIAPYSGCSIGEYWMENGKDVLIVYDDLSKQAVAYRTISLLLRRPPGREAYPGDVFYLHSRLLERAAKLSDIKGAGSLTALPIVETLAGDISAYIPTNVISITDGQIFLQSDSFNSGIRPAVDSGLSVSRVGSSAQTKAMKKVSGSLKIELAQYREVLDFARFGSDLDAATKKSIDHGERIVELLKQPQYSPYAMEDEVISIYAARSGQIDRVSVAKVKDYETKLITELHSMYPEVVEKLRTTGVLDAETEQQLKQAVESFTTTYVEINEVA